MDLRGTLLGGKDTGAPLLYARGCCDRPRGPRARHMGTVIREAAVVWLQGVQIKGRSAGSSPESDL